MGGRGADVFDLDLASHSAPGLRDVLRAADGAVAFEGAGAAAGDRIDVSGVDANQVAAGNQAFSFGGAGIACLSLVAAGASTLMRCNTDRDAAFELELADRGRRDARLRLPRGGLRALTPRPGDRPGRARPDPAVG